jgi:hypothetical protein
MKLENTGQYLVCSALIVGGGAKSFGIRLQIKPEIGKRWAAVARLPPNGLKCQHLKISPAA